MDAMAFFRKDLKSDIRPGLRHVVDFGVEISSEDSLFDYFLQRENLHQFSS